MGDREFLFKKIINNKKITKSHEFLSLTKQDYNNVWNGQIDSELRN